MTMHVRRRIVPASSFVVLAAFIGGTLVAPMASAQQSLERVEITGSSIKRIDAETALPVQIISRDEIERTGATNVEQFMQGLGVAVQGNSNTVAASASGATTGGVSGISLRGLGSQRTLVLIDGKRVSAGGTLTDSTTVDVNLIPLAAVERVEVLKDGASAIYGSEAIAGVVNFILRKDYRGAEATAFKTFTQHPGGAGKGFNALFGAGDLSKDRFNFTLVADYKKDDALFGRQRSFANSGINDINDTTSGNTFPANIAIPGVGTRNPSAPACPGPYAILDPNFPSTRCRFDPAPLVSLLPETEQRSLFGSMRLALASQHEAYGQFSISEKEQRTVIQPVPISDQFALPANHPLFAVAPYNGFSTFLLRSSSPYYPAAYIASQGGVGNPDVLVRYRSEGTGNRDLSDISLFTRAVVGLKGTVQAWDYDAAAFHIQTNLRERVNGGFPSLSRILPLLDSGQVNPFGANTPAVQAQLDATQFHGDAWKTKTSIDGASAKVSHDLMKMPGGPLALALGLEGRKEGFKLTPSPEIQSGDISGYGGNFLPVDKARNVGSAFTELNVPILRTLEATGAVRYDNYQGTGDKISPKIGLRWQPVRQALFRGSWGKGFRAPSLTELYQPQTIGVTANGVTDPARCPTTGSSNDCQTQFPITVGGSATLKPEVSTNRSIGMILEPVNNFSIGVDYWEVDLTNTIIFGIAPQAILNDPAKFPGLVTRAAPDPTCPGCPGQVIDINQVNTNLGETKIKGFDTNLLYRIPAAALGTFTASMNGTYFYKYSLQNPDGTFTSVNGMVGPTTQGVGGVIPRWRHYLALNWRLAPWDVTFAQQYQSHYRDMLGTLEDPTDPTCVCRRNVGEYALYHLYASYTGLFHKSLRVTLGLRNMFDRKPPYSNAGGQNYFQAGYDPGYADPRGRTFLISGTYKFK